MEDENSEVLDFWERWGPEALSWFAGANNIRVSRYFVLDEFESPDTGEVILDPKLLFKLEMLRRKIGYPVSIESGYRTPEHNIDVGGAEFSLHMKGKAADIFVRRKGLLIRDPVYPSFYSRRGLADCALQVGFGTVIVYVAPGKEKSIVHVDVRKHGLGYREE